jgi:hypothetical protein
VRLCVPQKYAFTLNRLNRAVCSIVTLIDVFEILQVMQDMNKAQLDKQDWQIHAYI